MGLFSRQKTCRLAPSDVEIRLRCLEASTRIASDETSNGERRNAIAEDAMRIADAYFAYVKGYSMRVNLRPVLEQSKPNSPRPELRTIDNQK